MNNQKLKELDTILHTADPFLLEIYIDFDLNKLYEVRKSLDKQLGISLSLKKNVVTIRKNIDLVDALIELRIMKETGEDSVGGYSIG